MKDKLWARQIDTGQGKSWQRESLLWWLCLQMEGQDAPLWLDVLGTAVRLFPASDATVPGILPHLGNNERVASSKHLMPLQF